MQMTVQGGQAKIVFIYLGLAAALFMMCRLILGGEVKEVLLVGIGFVVLGIAALAVGNWRMGLWLFLPWLLFEDLVRKYMGNNMAIYFGKDVLVGIMYISLFLSRGREKIPPLKPKFLLPLLFFVGLGIVQMFNPGSPSIWFGLLGAKIYFYYIPLMFVGYYLLRDEVDLRRFLVLSMALAAIIALIGIIQAIVGLNFLNPLGGAEIDELGHLTRVTPSGVLVARPPSVFVSEGRCSAYLILVFILGLGSAGYLLLRTAKGRKIVFAGLALVAVASFTSGSRGATVWVASSAVILSAAMMWGAPPRLQETYRLFKAIRRTWILGVIALVLMVMIFPDTMGARWTFYAETLDPRSADQQVSDRGWSYPVENLKLALSTQVWKIGQGIGTSSLGGQYVARLANLRPEELPSIYVEEGWGTMLIELGVPGLILWWVWTGFFVYEAWKTAMKVRGKSTFPVAMSIFWYGFILLWPFTFLSIGSIQNFILNAYFWLLTGVLFRLPGLSEKKLMETEVSGAPQLQVPM